MRAAVPLRPCFREFQRRSRAESRAKPGADQAGSKDAGALLTVIRHCTQGFALKILLDPLGIFGGIIGS
jgi:hypothetical protein